MGPWGQGMAPSLLRLRARENATFFALLFGVVVENDEDLLIGPPRDRREMTIVAAAVAVNASAGMRVAAEWF